MDEIELEKKAMAEDNKPENSVHNNELERRTRDAGKYVLDQFHPSLDDEQIEERITVALQIIVNERGRFIWNRQNFLKSTVVSNIIRRSCLGENSAIEFLQTLFLELGEYGNQSQTIAEIQESLIDRMFAVIQYEYQQLQQRGQLSDMEWSSKILVDLMVQYFDSIMEFGQRNKLIRFIELLIAVDQKFDTPWARHLISVYENLDLAETQDALRYTNDISIMHGF